MKPLILAIVVCCGALSVATAYAAPDYPAAGSAQNKLVVESVDSGGGSSARTSSVPAGMATHADHALDALRDASSSLGSSDPSAPAAATPRRPTYRWQSLVPGAIK